MIKSQIVKELLQEKVNDYIDGLNSAKARLVTEEGFVKKSKERIYELEKEITQIQEELNSNV